MTKLCFGSFGAIIKLHSGGTFTDSNAKIVSAIVGTIDPENTYADERTASHKMLSCNADFYRGEMKASEKKPLSNILQLVRDIDIELVIEKFKSDVFSLINEDKMESLIIWLLFIIENDAGIDVDNNPEVLQKYFGITVNPLENGVLVKVIKLSDFLAHILFYIVKIKKIKNNNAENQAFVKLIKEGAYIETISGEHHVLKRCDSEDSSPDYHVLKLFWDKDTQALTLISVKTKDNVMNSALIEQGAYNDRMTGIPVHRRYMPDSTEATKEKIRNDAISVDNTDIVLNYQEFDGIEISELCKSTLDEFESAISEYKFEDFISCEPLKEFTADSESKAHELKVQYNEYVDRIHDYNVSQLCFFNEYERYFDKDSQIENIQYTDKILTPRLLDMSKQLVSVLITKILPAVESSGHPVCENIIAFKEELKSYNKLLCKHLAVKKDGIVFNPEFNVQVDMEHPKEGEDYALKAISKALNCNIESIEIIPLFDDEDYMAFHSATRIKRAKINALYKEILDEINPSPNA